MFSKRVIFFMSKRVLITGAAGFIGSNLWQRCLHESWDVTGVDDLSNGHIQFLPSNVCSSKFEELDFSGAAILGAIKRQEFDAVIHLAACPRVGYSVDHPLETNDTNVSKTLALMDACRGNIERFVFASSSSVYGGAREMPTHETTRKDPRSPYALQKSIIEDYLSLYSTLFGMDSVCLRFFNVFGPCQLGSSPYACAISAWLTQIMKRGSMRSDGDGTQSRDLCYVDNVTDCCVRSVKYEGTLNAQPINVACGDRTTNDEIMQYLLDRFPDAKHHTAPWRPGDVMHTQADIGTARSVLGYEPLVRVWEGIDRTIGWYEANRNLVINTELMV